MVSNYFLSSVSEKQNEINRLSSNQVVRFHLRFVLKGSLNEEKIKKNYNYIESNITSNKSTENELGGVAEESDHDRVIFCFSRGRETSHQSQLSSWKQRTPPRSTRKGKQPMSPLRIKSMKML